MNASNSAVLAPDLSPDTISQQAQDLLSVSYAWFISHWLQIIIAVGVAALIVLALAFVRKQGEKLCRRDTGTAGWGVVFGRAIVKTGNFFLVMTAAKLVAGYAGAPAEVSATITFLFTVAAVFQAAIWAREIVLGSIELRTHSEEYTGEALGSAMGIIRLLVTFALFAIALIVVLDNLGVNVTGLVAGLGVGGIAIGLAAQGIFADLFAALAIIFDHPFRRGEVILYDNSGGTVEAIGLKSTRIRSVTGELRIIANRNLLDKEIQNNTRREYRRVKIAIGVIYQTPVATTRALPDMLKEIVESCGQTFVRAGFVGFGDSSLNFEVEFDAPADYQSFYDGRSAVGLAILDRLNEEGIEFAYPTQTTFTSAPDGRMIMPYAEVQPVKQIDPPAGG